MSAIDIGVIVLFLAYSIGVGLKARKASSENLEEYFLAGRTLPGWKAGLSMAATQFAADTPLLVTGLIATAGIFSLWRLWIYAIAFLLMGFLLSSSWRRAGVLTDAELTEIRYANKPAAVLRGVKAIYFGTVFNCTVLAIVLFAAKEIAEPFLPWHEWLPSSIFSAAEGVVRAIGMPLVHDASDTVGLWTRSTSNMISIGVVLCVSMLYSTTGGLRSVVEIDAVQFAVKMLVTMVYAVVVVRAVGGLDALYDGITRMFAEGRAPAFINADQILAITPDHAKDASVAVLAVLSLQWLVQINSDGTGYLAQRSMACRSDNDAKWAAVLFAFAQVFLRSLLWLPIGLGLLLLFPSEGGLSLAQYTAERETSYVIGMKDLMPNGLRGFMIIGMIAALASTVDTHLNWGSSYWANDIFKRFICEGFLKKTPSNRVLVWVARGANFLVLAIALFILNHLSSIQVAWHLSLLLGAGLGVMLILRWLWWRITAWSEIAALIASAITAPLTLRWIPDAGDAWRMLVVATVATTVGIIVALVKGPEPQDKLVTFYLRARPPGFWGPVAKAAGVSPSESVNRLWRGGLATFAAALSIFSLLVACATLMLHCPVPAWAPSRTSWVLSLFVVGLGLIPVWWRLGFCEENEEHAEGSRVHIDAEPRIGAVEAVSLD